jgi:Prion-inhibition and propagation
MVEPFGITAGAIGIATAFTACINCFEYIQFGGHFGRVLHAGESLLISTMIWDWVNRMQPHLRFNQ